MTFCLPKYAADALKEKFKSGEINPDKLMEITDSNTRRELLGSIIGQENAKQVNALFESKIPLKNQQAGLITWAETVLGMKPEIHKQFIDRVNKIEKFMNAGELDMFLSDAIEKKLGIHVSEAEAGKLIDLAKRTNDFKEEVLKFDNSPERKIDSYSKEELQKRLEYGTAVQMFKDYVSSLKPESKDLTFKEFITTPSKYVENISSIAKSIAASLDNSFWGNQGITTLLNPKTSDIWIKGFLKSWGDIGKALKGADPVAAIKADIYSRPNALNGAYENGKVAIGLHGEEAYPTSIPERIPYLGRLFKASQAAYNGAALRLRADRFDRLVSLANKNGVEITNKPSMQAIGHLVNSSTGRGSFGVGDASLKTWNNLMFSPRLLKGAFDTVTAHIFDKKIRVDPFARKQAAYQLLGMTATYYAVTSLWEASHPGSTEPDPRGAHFGQIKVGNNWINIIGPYRSLVRTLSTIVPTMHNGKLGFWRMNKKGKWEGIEFYPTKEVEYGALTPLDMAESFLEGKASPALSTFLNHLRGRDFQNNLPTLKGDVSNIAPITIKNYFQDKEDPKVDSAILNAVLNGIGVNVSSN